LSGVHHLAANVATLPATEIYRRDSVSGIPQACTLPGTIGNIDSILEENKTIY